MSAVWRTMMGLALLAPAVAASTAGDEQNGEWLIHAKHLYTANGDVIEGGWVMVRDGKISMVSKPRPVASFQEIEVDSVTPGLIDLSSRLHQGDASVENSTEVPANLRVAATLDLFSNAFAAELARGVTTVLVAPPDSGVISGLGIVLKTGGAPTLAARTVRGDAVLRGAMGDEPSDRNSPAFQVPTDFYKRRPTTRMGVEWVWRDSFHAALNARSDASLARPESANLELVLEGELPLFIQTWLTQDIRTAIFLKQEFKLPFVILDAAAEVWKDPDMVARAGVGVVLPPHAQEGRIGPEGAFHAWNSAALLEARGVPFALSSHGSSEPGADLAAQPGYAMRGGASFEAVLAAVTITPARFVGVQDRVGSIEVGKDADLVLWSGPPFELSSRIVGVLLDGRLEVDARSQ